METNEKQNSLLYNLSLVFGILGAISGVILTVHNLSSTTDPAQGIVIFSLFYFTIIIFAVAFAVIFTIQWNKTPKQENESKPNELHAKFLAALKESGITGVYSNQDWPFQRIHDELSRQIKTGGKIKIKIITYYGYNLLSSIQSKLSKAMDNGAKIKILIAESNSDFMKEVWKLETKVKQQPIDDSDKQEKALDIIKGLEKRAKDTGKYFKYKTYKTHIRYALVAINETWAWWTPYQPGIIGPETTSFVLESNDQTSILGQCIKHFTALWEILPDCDTKK